MELLLLGNGLDIALSQKTKVTDYVSWLKTVKDSKLLLNILGGKNKKEQLFNFLEIYNIWLISKFYDDSEWNLLEKHIKEFFINVQNDWINFKLNTNLVRHKKETTFKNMKNGYLLFCYLMQYYYIHILTRKNNKKNYNIIDNKLKRFIEFLNTKDIIVSLNYTDFLDFTPSNYTMLVSKGIYYPHYIMPGTLFSNYGKNIYAPTPEQSILNYANFGDATNLLSLKYNSIEKESRIIYSKPQKHWKRAFPNAISITKYYQLLILGNEDIFLENNTELDFLTKNNNPMLFMQNYPTFVFELIKTKIINNSKINLFVFGYSFNSADIEVNSFLTTNIIKDNVIPKFIFFEEDIDKNDLTNSNLINQSYSNYSNYCILHKKNQPSITEFVSSILVI